MTIYLDQLIKYTHTPFLGPVWSRWFEEDLIGVLFFQDSISEVKWSQCVLDHSEWEQMIRVPRCREVFELYETAESTVDRSWWNQCEGNVWKANCWWWPDWFLSFPRVQVHLVFWADRINWQLFIGKSMVILEVSVFSLGKSIFSNNFFKGQMPQH